MINYFQTYYLFKTGSPLSDVILDIYQLKNFYRIFGETISKNIIVVRQTRIQKGIFSAN